MPHDAKMIKIMLFQHVEEIIDSGVEKERKGNFCTNANIPGLRGR
jgi:hypothetical protein